MMTFYVNNTNLESMIKQIFIKFDSSNLVDQYLLIT